MQVRLMQRAFSNANDINLFLMIFLCMSPRHKLIPVQCRGYETHLTNRVRGPYYRLRTKFFIDGEKKRGSETHELNKIFISTVCLTGSATIFIHGERLQISDAPLNQNESI